MIDERTKELNRLNSIISGRKKQVRKIEKEIANILQIKVDDEYYEN